jgi:hypothetical protein
MRLQTIEKELEALKARGSEKEVDRTMLEDSSETVPTKSSNEGKTSSEKPKSLKEGEKRE